MPQKRLKALIQRRNQNLVASDDFSFTDDDVSSEKSSILRPGAEFEYTTHHFVVVSISNNIVTVKESLTGGIHEMDVDLVHDLINEYLE